MPNLNQLIAFLQNNTWGLKVFDDFLTNENIKNHYQTELFFINNMVINSI